MNYNYRPTDEVRQAQHETLADIMNTGSVVECTGRNSGNPLRVSFETQDKPPIITFQVAMIRYILMLEKMTTRTMPHLDENAYHMWGRLIVRGDANRQMQDYVHLNQMNMSITSCNLTDLQVVKKKKTYKRYMDQYFTDRVKIHTDPTWFRRRQRKSKAKPITHTPPSSPQGPPATRSRVNGTTPDKQPAKRVLFDDSSGSDSEYVPSEEEVSSPRPQVNLGDDTQAPVQTFQPTKSPFSAMIRDFKASPAPAPVATPIVVQPLAVVPITPGRSLSPPSEGTIADCMELMQDFPDLVTMSNCRDMIVHPMVQDRSPVDRRNPHRMPHRPVDGMWRLAVTSPEGRTFEVEVDREMMRDCPYAQNLTEIFDLLKNQ